MLFIFKAVYRRYVRKSLNEIILGRMKAPGHPQAGRFLASDIELLLENTWRNIDEMLPEANLDRLPTVGSRHNVFLAVLTVGLYHALIDAGIERAYAMELFADAGWKLYVTFLGLPKRIARIVSRDPQRQMNVILRMLLRFPFSTSGRPGYEAQVWAKDDRFVTHWTWCPPLQFVKQYVETHGDRGEIEAFCQSWCSYDWAFAYAMMDGSSQKGYYQRPHTLSQGDDVCDMCWSAKTLAQA